MTLPKAGEGRVNALDYALRHNGFADIYIFWQLRAQFCAVHASTSSDDVMSVHNDVQVWLRIATSRILCIISKSGHPRMDSFSVVWCGL